MGGATCAVVLHMGGALLQRYVTPLDSIVQRFIVIFI